MGTPYKAKQASQQTDLEALSGLVATGQPLASNSFANDLVRKGQRYALSSKQMYWVTKFVKENTPDESGSTPAEATAAAIPADQVAAVARLGAVIEHMKNDSFAVDLHRKGQRFTLSEKQMVWVVKKAEEGEARVARAAEAAARAAEAARIAALPPTLDGGWDAVTALFAKASETLRTMRLKVRLNGDDAGRSVFSIRLRRGEEATAFSTPWGDVDMNTNVLTAKPEQVFPADLSAFKADPVAYMAEQGKKEGNCCFCSRDLTDERSTAHGYGPICAKHYGLAWGHDTAEAIEEAITEAVTEVRVVMNGGVWAVVDAETSEVIATFTTKQDALDYTDETTTIEVKM